MEMTDADRLFVDTNILVYATDSQSSFHLAAQQRLDEIRQHGTSMVISSQVLREYLAVTTRSSATGERVPLPEILTNIQIFRQEFEVVNENSAVFDQLLRLLEMIPAGGKQVHDANIVATMQANQIKFLLTHNTTDFSRYSHPVTLLDL